MEHAYKIVRQHLTLKVKYSFINFLKNVNSDVVNLCLGTFLMALGNSELFHIGFQLCNELNDLSTYNF